MTQDNYHYAVIGNCTSAALVSEDCSIDWLCLPFFDSPSVFGRMLDEHKGGYFKITSRNIIKVEQNYVMHSPILRTVFTTQDGIFEVRDYMPRFRTSREDYYCPSEIHRDILLISGRPEIVIELAPRPNYALSDVQFETENGRIKMVSRKGEYVSFYLYSNLDHAKILSGEPMVLTETSYLLMSYHEKLAPIDKDKIYIEYEKTKTYWLDWVDRCTFPKAYKDWLIRSAVTLKLMTYQRTGAVIAAPTTSLPEIIGQERNWDYRYCWIRDSSMIVDLYMRIGHFHSSARFMHFVLNRLLLKHEDISVMYGINGERMLTEKTLDHLDGYQGSRPVRIGNDAYRQIQNDLYGQLIEALYTYFVINRRRDKEAIDEEIWTIVRAMARTVMKNWRQPDNGIWEQRGEPRHYVHSKLMSWVAMDRAAKIAVFVGKSHYAAAWRQLADEIKADVLAQGWSEQAQAFTMFYGSQDLDAANLLMLHYGFLGKDDPRIVSTVRKTREHLTKNGFTFRYTCSDDFGAPKNAFVVCTFWMINALYLIGEEGEARAMLDNILSCANRFGLFAEDVDVDTRRLTGNFPQGYSHLALIQTILLMETNYNWSDAFAVRNGY